MMDPIASVSPLEHLVAQPVLVSCACKEALSYPRYMCVCGNSCSPKDSPPNNLNLVSQGYHFIYFLDKLLSHLNYYSNHQHPKTIFPHYPIPSV